MTADLVTKALDVLGGRMQPDLIYLNEFAPWWTVQRAKEVIDLYVR